MTFMLVYVAWIFFRAENLTAAWHYVSKIGSSSFFHIPDLLPKTVFFFIGVLLLLELLGREQQYALAIFGRLWPRILRRGLYVGIAITIFLFAGQAQPFIYFQF